MIWATVSSQSCFCWLYRASTSLTAKNIINLVSVLTIWWFPCVELCCWKMVFATTSAFSWQNSISLCPASFCTPRPNLPVTPGVSWFPPFVFQSPQLVLHYWSGHRLGLPWYWMVCLENEQRSFCRFWDCTIQMLDSKTRPTFNTHTQTHTPHTSYLCASGDLGRTSLPLGVSLNTSAVLYNPPRGFLLSLSLLQRAPAGT